MPSKVRELCKLLFDDKEKQRELQVYLVVFLQVQFNFWNYK